MSKKVMVNVGSLLFAAEPGCYKWWAKRQELDKLLQALGLNYDRVKNDIEKYGDLFCIYVGKSKKIRKRLVCNHIDGSIRCSTLRKTIAGLMNIKSEQEINQNFIDKFSIEPMYINPQKEKEIINEPNPNKPGETYLRILNSDGNEHNLAIKTIEKIKKARERAEKNIPFTK
jgi:hypothetical protein